MRKITGYTADSAEKLLLGAGAFFRNYDLGTDTYESAKAAGKCIGLTQGGGEFKYTPEVNYTAADGIPENTMGMAHIDGYQVYIKASVLEVTPELIKEAMIGTNSNGTVTPNSEIADADYIENITWVGELSGSNKTVTIQIFNALHTEGLTITATDKGEAKVDMTYYGHYDGTTPACKVKFD